MQKWEYLEMVCEVSYEDGDPIQTIYANGHKVENARFFSFLKSLGGDGWELISTHLRGSIEISNNVYYFKRPVE